MESRNPFSGKLIERFEHSSEHQIDEAIRSAHRQFQIHRKTSHRERAKMLRRVAQALRQRKDQIAFRITNEMGKCISQSQSEVEKSARCAEHYAENAESYLQGEQIELDGKSCVEVAYAPTGVVFSILPWNFPLWQGMRFAIPAWAAGNTVVFKHAVNVCGVAQEMEDLVAKATGKTGFLQNVRIDHDKVRAIVFDDRIRSITLTGSEKAGSAVGRLAGEAIKNCVLELGGSDAYLVLEDADIGKAADAIFQSRMINTGQSCIGAKRVIASKKIHDQLRDALIARCETIDFSDPSNSEAQLGPLARRDLVNNVEQQVQGSIQSGCRLAFEKKAQFDHGFFSPLRVLDGVKPGMPAFDQEVFGPVIAISSAETERELIELSNRSRYGLGGAIFSRDKERALRIAREELDTGGVGVNDFLKSDPRAPFGGVKMSGVGRELGRPGATNFANQKTLMYLK